MSDTLLNTIYQNSKDLLTEVGALLDAGADPNVITEYGESPLRVASNNGRLDVVRLLLSRGADESQLGWTRIFHVIAYGSIDNIEEVITGGSDLKHRDYWSRTPLLFSIVVGDSKKTAKLIEAGANVEAVGHCGQAPLSYATLHDDVNMLNWLLDHGFDPEQTNEFGDTPLIIAAERGATNCVQALIDRGTNIFAENNIPEQAIAVAGDFAIVNALVNAGADINDVSKETRAALLGYSVDEAPDISAEEYHKGKRQIFGKSNPERANNPFWLSMVRCGGSAYLAANKCDPKRDIYKDRPVWSFDRIGKSMTVLPDGRVIEIAGEHEDYYDPDFCIYNDVFVHDCKGNCEIYIYPREVFPPTDFHTATLVGEHIYIIGNLGDVEDRRPGYTQVFRLNIKSLKVERLETGGVMPGWISKHKASYDGQSGITVKNGKLIVDKNGNQDYIANDQTFTLCLNTMTWTKCKSGFNK